MQATILNREIALKMINKSITDIVAVISMLVALVTGFMLHNEIHHSHIYHDVRLWSLHETSGLVWMVIMVLHCVQHTPWFENYTEIPLRHKAVSTSSGIISADSYIRFITDVRQPFTIHFYSPLCTRHNICVGSGVPCGPKVEDIHIFV